MYKVIRDVTRAECPWLGTRIEEGTRVYPYKGCTYGCVGAGVAVTLVRDKTPFFELPRDALKRIASC